MRYCCVPMCTSSARKKDPGVSFHEIPADLELRRQWIKVISRKDWEPNSTSNYSVVCSKHFVASDFKENSKIRQLKKGVVPSMFACYPSYKQPSRNKVRSDPRSRKRAPELDNDSCPKKKQKTAISLEMGDPATTDDAAETGDAPTAVAARTIESPGENTFPVDDLSSVASTVLASTTTSEEQLVYKAVARDEPLAFARRAFGTQTDTARTSASNFLHHRKCREKERALRLQILRLKQTLDIYKEELRKLKDDCNVDTFLDVATDAQQKSLKASFIMDQINNSTKKRATWNETTVRYCIVLRNLSTKAYEYIRSEGLLRLPCRNTLHKYIGTSTGEVGFSPLVPLRLQTEFESLPADQSKVCCLIVDEMHIKQKLEYNKQ
ncbi:hypothetical protein HPB50_013813 [Hyalomma asiaticum]|uniref:Uncharacterized protein n=1 Tax=Hyalomma asiaticum TaxID=266040 RepID=A0ACB7RWM6_HYAAI|nr:hypothetical protein HPB50_013813 [Hyalomma asiaticum]